MDALMSQIMTNARMKANGEVTPLDLSYKQLGQHTCDSLINHEDMRTDPDVECVSDDDDQKLVIDTEWSATQCTPEQPPTPGSHCSKRSTVTSRRDSGIASSVKLHPFSIAALLGENHESNSPCVAAEVFSPFSTSGSSYPVYTRPYVNQTQLAKDADELSPIRGVSMLKSEYVYWCHACNKPCVDRREAESHRLTHLVHRSPCSLRRQFLHEHGHVTRHEQLDMDRVHCSLCNKVVALCFFNKHQRLHEGHFCHVCGQEFSTNSRLKDHVNVHTGSLPFTCAICDRKFAKRSSLTQHQRYHRDHKSFPCRFCQKSFNSKYACAVHERLHTGENPFKCQFPGCSRAFPQKIQLKLHINSNHKSYPQFSNVHYHE